MVDRVEALKAELAYVEAGEKFVAAKLASKAKPDDAKLAEAYRKAQEEYIPLVDAYRAARSAPDGPGDGTAKPGSIAASSTTTGKG